MFRSSDIKVLSSRGFLLYREYRYGELIPTAQTILSAFPSAAGPRLWLAICLEVNGRTADAIPVLEEEIRINGRAPTIFSTYANLGFALAFLGRHDEAIPGFHRAIAANPSSRWRSFLLPALAATEALAGHARQARTDAAEASRLWPTLTARSYFEQKLTNNPGAIAQVERIRDGLRLAGVRDQADENADTGLAPDNVLHTDYYGQTPATVFGARTIKTHDLASLLDQRKPLVLDVSVLWGATIPGAIGLWGAGIGGTPSDSYQARLRSKMQELIHNDLTAPIVTMGWNAERYQSRNLAMRLVALGYTNIYWYRGGREAWATASLPQAEIDMQDW